MVDLKNKAADLIATAATRAGCYYVNNNGSLPHITQMANHCSRKPHFNLNSSAAMKHRWLPMNNEIVYINSRIAFGKNGKLCIIDACMHMLKTLQSY